MKKQTSRQLAWLLLEAYGPMTCGQLGWLLWRDTTKAPRRGEGSHGTNKFCRPAGKLLKGMKAEGLVCLYYRKNDSRILWRARSRA